MFTDGDPRLGFGLLGPLCAWQGERPLDMGAPQQQAVLAALLVRAGHVVSRAELVDAVWGERAPSSAVNVLQSYVARLRGVLELGRPPRTSPRVLVTSGDGYVLRAAAGQVDLGVFEQRCAAAWVAHAGGDLAGASAELGQAMELWRGTALAGIPGPFAQIQRDRLAEVRLATLEARLDLDLDMGRHREVVAELAALVAEHPLRERLRAQLMLALYRSERPADALAAYRQCRRLLANELGIDPGVPLQRLHQAILANAPEIAAPHQPAALTGEGAVLQGVGRGQAGLPETGPSSIQIRAVPAQLPADASAFTGRQTELADLDTLLAGAGTTEGTSGSEAAAVVISAVSGTAGVGKTALAVHWAHRARGRFPDGQLYVNLRGYDPGQPMTPADVLARFLTALGVAGRDIPVDLDDRAARYRTETTDQQILIMLDNASTVEQVRPLLPGTPTCAVIVTSRDALAGLVAVHGARRIDLDLLPLEDAVALLRRLIGPRVDNEPQAAATLAAQCARLPLALRIAAELADSRPAIRLAELVTELEDSRRRLDLLDAGDARAAVTAVLSWSYHALTPEAARLFRLLGLHPGPDISAAAAASLAGHPLPEARRVLTALTRAHLLAEHVPGRYTFHDLLRAYATDLAHTHDPDSTRRAAMTRLLDHYTHTAHTAERVLDPSRDPIPLPPNPPAPGANPEHPADHQQAMAWLTTEQSVLLATLRQAAHAGFDTYTWQLAWALHTFLYRQVHWHDLTTVWQAALHSARCLGHPAAQAYAHRYLGRAHIHLSRFDDAHTHLRHALDLHIQTGDQLGQAHTHNDHARLLARQGCPEQALHPARQALTLYRATSYRRGQATALNEIGLYYSQLGEHIEALTYCEQALTLHQQVGNRQGEAATWDSLGYAHHHLGHHAQAADRYQHAVTLYRDIGARYYQAIVLTHLGDTHHAAGDTTAARTTWQQALDILLDLDHPDASPVSTKLHNLDQPSTTTDVHAQL